MFRERTRNLHDGCCTGRFGVSEIGTGGGEFAGVGGNEEESRAGVRRYAAGEAEGVFVDGGPVDELVRRGGAYSIRPVVGIGHRDAGRWRQPDGDRVRGTTKRGGAGEDAVVEIEQAGDVGPNHAKLNLNRNSGAECKQNDLRDGVVEHQAGELWARCFRGPRQGSEFSRERDWSCNDRHGAHHTPESCGRPEI
jgi:hypothetical protein